MLMPGLDKILILSSSGNRISDAICSAGLEMVWKSFKLMQNKNMPNVIVWVLYTPSYI